MTLVGTARCLDVAVVLVPPARCVVVAGLIVGRRRQC